MHSCLSSLSLSRPSSPSLHPSLSTPPPPSLSLLYINTYMRACSQAHRHTLACVHTHKYIHTHTYMLVNVHTHERICVCTRSLSLSLSHTHTHTHHTPHTHTHPARETNTRSTVKLAIGLMCSQTLKNMSIYRYIHKLKTYVVCVLDITIILTLYDQKKKKKKSETKYNLLV